jgi:hypothetical protein
MTELPRTSHAIRGQNPARQTTVGAAPQTGRRSYIARHWHGELSLGRAFWLNGIVVGLVFIVVALVAIVIPYLLGFDTAEWAPLPGLVASIIAGPVLLSWQSVGIWRSASHRNQKHRVRAWSILAKVATILGLVLFAHDFMFRLVPSTIEHARFAFGTGGLDPHEISLSSDGLVLNFSGGISNAAVADVERMLDKHGAVRAIFLDSRGGQVLAAEHLRDLIRHRALDTYVAKRCFSACTTAFLGGQERGIIQDATFGFHQMRSAVLYSYETAIFNRMARDDMVTWGVAPAFAHKAFEITSDSAWYPSVSELLAAHVATRIVSTDDIQRRLTGKSD